MSTTLAPDNRCSSGGGSDAMWEALPAPIQTTVMPEQAAIHQGPG